MGRDIILTILCVAGLIFAVMVLYGRLLRPVLNPDAKLILPGRGDGRTLEQSVRGAVWLRNQGLLDCTIVIADIDLDTAGRELAMHLLTRWSGVVLWPVNELPEYIRFYH